MHLVDDNIPLDGEFHGYDELDNERSGIGKLQVTALLWIGVIVIYCLFFASVIIISAKQFSNEKDSNKIYAFSSIIIALISCIISTVTFVVQFLM